jgi:hypothetical protein
MNIGGSKKEEKQTIKEKLTKGLYNSQAGGYGLWKETPLGQRNIAAATLIGKRADPFGQEFQKPYSQYFVKKE